jgi:hypothetical protein
MSETMMREPDEAEQRRRRPEFISSGLSMVLTRGQEVLSTLSPEMSREEMEEIRDLYEETVTDVADNIRDGAPFRGLSAPIWDQVQEAYNYIIRETGLDLDPAIIRENDPSATELFRNPEDAALFIINISTGRMQNRAPQEGENLDHRRMVANALTQVAMDIHRENQAQSPLGSTPRRQ